MKLNIINPTANSFNEAVGISEERSNELGKLLDDLCTKLTGQVVRTCYLMDEIAGFCNNTEELVFCTITHCNYVAIKYGIFLCPPKPKS
jgi:hypothetical protein